MFHIFLNRQNNIPQPEHPAVVGIVVPVVVAVIGVVARVVTVFDDFVLKVTEAFGDVRKVP